jgi:hypothetical protein
MSAADSLFGIHRIRTLTEGPYTRKQLRLAGSATLEDDPEEGEVVINIGSGRIWHTLLDFDFAEVASQALATDTTYDLDDGNAEVTWTKRNSAEDVAAAAIENGTGLVLCPSSGLYNYTTNCISPALSARIGDLVSDESVIGSSTPLRAMVRGYADTTGGSNDNHIGIGLDYYVSSSAYACIMATHRYAQTTPSGGMAHVKPASTAITVLSANNVLTSYDVPAIWMPDGVGGIGFRHGRGLWNAGWPDEIPFFGGWAPDGEYWDTDCWPEVGYGSNWSVSVFATAQAENASYRWVIQNVKLEALY